MLIKVSDLSLLLYNVYLSSDPSLSCMSPLGKKAILMMNVVNLNRRRKQHHPSDF